MRKAMIYNFLLEATIIASIAILLMLLVRKLLRKQLGKYARCITTLRGVGYRFEKNVEES